MSDGVRTGRRGRGEETVSKGKGWKDLISHKHWKDEDCDFKAGLINAKNRNNQIKYNVFFRQGSMQILIYTIIHLTL